MTRSLLFILFIILMVLAGCIFDSDDNGKDNTVTDAGNFTLAITSPLYVSTTETDSSFLELENYADATYILFITIHPDSAYKGSVKLSATASEGLQTEFLASELTAANTFTEVMFTPVGIDSYTEYDINIIASHGGVADTTKITMGAGGLFPYNTTTDIAPFISWIHEQFPSITGLDENDNWEGYDPYVKRAGVSMHVYYNDTWMIVRDVYGLYDPYYYQLRKRGEQYPVVAVCRNYHDNSWITFNPVEWDNRY